MTTWKLSKEMTVMKRKCKELLKKAKSMRIRKTMMKMKTWRKRVNKMKIVMNRWMMRAQKVRNKTKRKRVESNLSSKESRKSKALERRSKL